MIDKYRIKEIRYANKTEYWCEKSICLLGVHLFWDKTTISYHSKFEYEKKHFEDIIGSKIEVLYFFTKK